MLSLSDRSPGCLWLKTPPVSFIVYSTTNPDMVTVFFSPLNDEIPDTYQDNFSTFKKQLLDMKIIKGEIESMKYIDDEDDVIHIDSEYEFMEVLKFARACKEKNGQSVFLMIDEKSEEEVTESAMIHSDDDKAESIVDEVMGTRKIVFDKSKGKGFASGGESKAKSLKEKRRYKSAKVDDKLEANACCQKNLEKFKQEIVAEVTKNVIKKIASVFNAADLNVDAAKETPEEETRDQPEARQPYCNSKTNALLKSIRKSTVISPKKRAQVLDEAVRLELNAAVLRMAIAPKPDRPKTNAETNVEAAAQYKTLDREYSIHKVPNYPYHPAFYRPNPPVHFLPSHPMVPPFYSSFNPMPYVRPGSIMGPSGPPPFPRVNNSLNIDTSKPHSCFAEGLILAPKPNAPICSPPHRASEPFSRVNDSLTLKIQPNAPICSPPHRASKPFSVLAPAPAPAPAPALASAEEKNLDSQKKKPKVTDYVVLNRDDLTEEQKNLLDQAKKIKFKKPNALEIKSTIKKMATPSPKKSSSSKIKNKNKIEKELMMNVKKMYNIKIDDQVQKTSGCKRKSRSNDEIINLWATRCSLLNYTPGTDKFDAERAFNPNIENVGPFAMPSLVSVKDEDRGAKAVKDAIEDNHEKIFDQDELSSSDDASTLSETSNLSIPSDTNNFELVYYDKDTNDFGMKDDFIKKYSQLVTGSAGQDTTQSGNKIEEEENKISTESGSKPLKQSDEPTKEVRIEVEVKDIGPEEYEELIPELNKRSGGGYSFVSETLPKAEEIITESTASADDKNTEKEKSSQEYEEQCQQSSEFDRKLNYYPTLSQLNAKCGYEKQNSEKSTTETKTKSEKKSKDKESQQKRPSHSETVPDVSAHCFDMKSSAENLQIPKMSKEKKKKLEEKLKEVEKKCKVAEKKSKSAQDESSQSKTARDDYRSSSSRYSGPGHNISGLPRETPPFNPCHMTRSGDMPSGNPGSSLDSSLLILDEIVGEAVAQALVHARKAVNDRLQSQFNNHKF